MNKNSGFFYTEPLGSLIRRTLLRDASLRSAVVEYAIEHSLSVERVKTNTGLGGYLIARDMLDWFVRVAEAFEKTPTGYYSRVGNVLWLSKDVAVSMSMLRNAEPEAVDAFLERVPEGVRRPCNAETADLLRECCLTHDFFSYAVRSAIFDDVALFRDGFHFVARVLHRARYLGNPLTHLELLYAAARPVTWNVVDDVNPWDRRWTTPHAKVSSGVVYEGQRRAAALFERAEAGNLALDLDEAPSAPFRWFLDNGKPEKSPAMPDNTWARHLTPWVSGIFVDENSEGTVAGEFNSGSLVVEKVASFLMTVAAFDSFPEAFELCMDAWSQSEETIRTILKRFPHLQRVALRVLRLRRECEPPRSLCEAIVREARKESIAGGPAKKFSRKMIQAWAREERVETVASRLREEGCEEAAQRLETFATRHGGHDARSFETTGKHGHITWLDVVTSKRNAWDIAHGEDATAIARTSDRAYVMTIEKNISFYRHPLSKLLTQESARPLSSRMPELLVACA